jgi:hypothetical protein
MRKEEATFALSLKPWTLTLATRFTACQSTTRPTATRSPPSCSATATDGVTTGRTWVDFLPMHPDARRKVARFLGEIDAADQR